MGFLKSNGVEAAGALESVLRDAGIVVRSSTSVLHGAVLYRTRVCSCGVDVALGTDASGFLDERVANECEHRVRGVHDAHRARGFDRRVDSIITRVGHRVRASSVIVHLVTPM